MLTGVEILKHRHQGALHSAGLLSVDPQGSSHFPTCSPGGMAKASVPRDLTAGSRTVDSSYASWL